jgi:ABC-type polysaccharide/polyol phosphate transport system ATPase subunit
MSIGKSVIVNDLSKVFHIYDRPLDRLKESLSPFGTRYSRDFNALQNISFDLNQGESFGILGMNGAGKSTLLKMITGVLTPSAGSVELHGKVSSLLELGTGFDPELTGIENIFLYGSLMGFETKEMASRLDAIVSFADIGEFVEQPVKTYSSGMFARLAFAAAINVTPRILIVDEVLSVGDAAFQKKCIVRINELREDGVTILLVSHDEYLIRKLCQKAMFLENGICKYIGDPELCLAEYKSSFLKPKTKSKPEYRVESVSTEAEVETASASQVASADRFSFSIMNVEIKSSEGGATTNFETGDTVHICADCNLLGTYSGGISLVANIYGPEGVYVWGTTTLMGGIAAQAAQSLGKIELIIKDLPLLSGKYVLRLAINDDTGLCIFYEANPAAEFTVIDNFQSVGLIDLQHEWIL